MAAADAARTVRGLLVLSLHEQYPLQLSEASLRGRLRPFYAGDGAVARLRRDLAYLREKGLVLDEETRLAGRVVRSWKLTADGVDVAEGSVTDPGVIIERER